MELETKQLTFDAAKKLYEKGLAASSVVRSLRKGGHALTDVAFAAKQFGELDAMLFGDAWGKNRSEQREGRIAFLEAR